MFASGEMPLGVPLASLTDVAPPLPYIPEQAPEALGQGIYSSRDPQVGGLVLAKAQEVHTIRYLAEGYIKPDDLTDGVYTEYADRSTYFLSINGKKDTVGRQIACDKKQGILSLPTAEFFQIDTEAFRNAAGVKKLADIKPAEIVEISALASIGKNNEIVEQSDSASVLLLYSRMLRESLERGQKYWMLNTTPKVTKHLFRAIGAENFYPIGESRMFMGSETTPYLIKPQEVVRAILGSDESSLAWRKTFLKSIFDGVNDKAIPKDIRGMLTENNIETTRTSKFRKAITNPKFIASAGLAAYCAARVLPVGQIEEFHGDLGVLWAADFLTIYPYVDGLERMYKSRTVGGRALGLAEAAVSFSVPYDYLYLQGDSYPTYVNALVGGLVLTGVAKEVHDRISSRRREQRLQSGLSVPMPEASAS